MGSNVNHLDSSHVYVFVTTPDTITDSDVIFRYSLTSAFKRNGV